MTPEPGADAGAAEAARKRRRHRNERIAASILVLAVAAGAAGVIAWNRRVERDLQRDQTYVPKPAAVTPELLALQEFVRIDTSTPQGSANGARWIAAYLAKHGVRAELIESAPGRLNVYARIRGRNRGGGLLLFNHIDVVPPGNGWQLPPFEARIVDGQLVGRGVLDMKGVTLCQLVAFVDVAKGGKTPAHDLAFLATADEETGSEFGMQWLLAHRPDVFEDIAFGITEGGITEMIRERMTYFGIETGGKQAIKVTLASQDGEGMRRARIALEPYMTFRQPDRILPGVREHFRALAPSRRAFQPYLADIDAAVRDGHFWRLPQPYRELTQNTIWASGQYHMPAQWQLDMHLRNLPDEDPDARLQWLESVIAPHGVRVAYLWSKEGPVPLSPSGTPLFELLAREARRRYKVDAGVQILYRSTSDSRFLRPRGIACYGVSPFPVDSFQSLTIHAANERLSIAGFADGIDYLRNVVRDWAGSE